MAFWMFEKLQNFFNKQTEEEKAAARAQSFEPNWKLSINELLPLLEKGAITEYNHSMGETLELKITPDDLLSYQKKLSSWFRPIDLIIEKAIKLSEKEKQGEKSTLSRLIMALKKISPEAAEMIQNSVTGAEHAKKLQEALKELKESTSEKEVAIKKVTKIIGEVNLATLGRKMEFIEEKTRGEGRHARTNIETREVKVGKELFVLGKKYPEIEEALVARGGEFAAYIEDLYKGVLITAGKNTAKASGQKVLTDEEVVSIVRHKIKPERINLTIGDGVRILKIPGSLGITKRILPILIETQNYDAIKLVLDRGANPNLGNVSEGNPMHDMDVPLDYCLQKFLEKEDATADSEFFKIAKLLIDYGADATKISQEVWQELDKHPELKIRVEIASILSSTEQQATSGATKEQKLTALAVTLVHISSEPEMDAAKIMANVAKSGFSHEAMNHFKQAISEAVAEKAVVEKAAAEEAAAKEAAAREAAAEEAKAKAMKDLQIAKKELSALENTFNAAREAFKAAKEAAAKEAAAKEATAQQQSKNGRHVSFNPVVETIQDKMVVEPNSSKQKTGGSSGNKKRKHSEAAGNDQAKQTSNKKQCINPEKKLSAREKGKKYWEEEIRNRDKGRSL